MATKRANGLRERETLAKDGKSVTESVQGQNVALDLVHKVAPVILMGYILWATGSMIAWISHLGARVKVLEPFLAGGGHARNYPVEDIFGLVFYNLPVTVAFVLPHSLLRPPTWTRLVGQRYGRIMYCTMAAATIHLALEFIRPMNMNSFMLPREEYVYNETANLPMFTLPVPKVLHDILSISMMFFSFFALLTNPDSYVVLGFNRAFYGADSPKGNFPKGLSPRMDFITWMGYVVWLRAGGLGFILFSGLSILPYKVYAWDIIIRVVAACYLRVRSQGFRIWVGKIEQTHHLIWILRGLIVVSAMGYQYHLLSKNQEVDAIGNSDLLNMKTIGILCISGVALAVLLDRLEKIR